MDPSARDAIRPLHSPGHVEVREDVEREQASVLGPWRRVERIDDLWTFDLWWLPDPVAPTYYRIDSGDDGLVTVFVTTG